MYGITAIAFIAVGILAISPNGHTIPAVIPAILIAAGMGAFVAGTVSEG